MKNVFLKKSQFSEVEILIGIDLTAVWSLFYKPYTTEADWLSAFNKGDIYFIMYNGKIVGNIYFYKKTDQLAYLDGFLVKPEFQHQWFWSDALWLIIDIATKEWYSSMELITHPDNLFAQKVYIKNGFIKWQITKNYYGDGEPRIYFLNDNLWNS